MDGKILQMENARRGTGKAAEKDKRRCGKYKFRPHGDMKDEEPFFLF